jgi:hypothetical protein
LISLTESWGSIEMEVGWVRTLWWHGGDIATILLRILYWFQKYSVTGREYGRWYHWWMQITVFQRSYTLTYT